MERYLNKCNGVEEVAAVGVTTRSKSLAMETTEVAGEKRRKVEDGELQISSYIQLRSRTLVISSPGKMKKRRRSHSPSSSRPERELEAVNSRNGDISNFPSGPDVGRISSRCSSNASSCDVAAAAEREVEDECSGSRQPEGTASYNLDFKRGEDEEEFERRREGTPSSELESTGSRTVDNASPGNRSASGRAKTTRSSAMPSDVEIEEFFAAAENDERKKFSEKYNYDVVKDVPLDGRYEWVALMP